MKTAVAATVFAAVPIWLMLWRLLTLPIARSLYKARGALHRGHVAAVDHIIQIKPLCLCKGVCHRSQSLREALQDVHYRDSKKCKVSIRNL